jgi:hypothetical protein
MRLEYLIGAAAILPSEVSGWILDRLERLSGSESAVSAAAPRRADRDQHPGGQGCHAAMQQKKIINFRWISQLQEPTCSRTMTGAGTGVIRGATNQ